MKRLDSLRVRAHAKINLYLDVIGKRADGYHELETVFHSIDLHDVIIICRRDRQGITVHCEHPEVPCDESNIVYRAAQSLSDTVGGFGGVEIQIHKRIPVAAGLGGGSANAAAVLHGINQLFSLGLPQDTLMQLGVQLGADVPFCLLGGAALGHGIGEILTPLPALVNVPLLLLNRGVAILTANVFKNLHFFLTNEKKVGIIIKTYVEKGDVVGISENLYNLLEVPVFSKYPELATLKTELAKQPGCSGALMSGSGATVFGVMEDIAAAQQAESHFKNNVNFHTTTATSAVGVYIDN